MTRGIAPVVLVAVALSCRHDRAVPRSPRPADVEHQQAELDARERRLATRERAVADAGRTGPVRWTRDYEAARRRAKRAGTLLLLTFNDFPGAERWEPVLSTPEARAALSDFVWYDDPEGQTLRGQLSPALALMAVIVDPTTNQSLAHFLRIPTSDDFLRIVLAARRTAGLAPNPAMKQLAAEPPQVDATWLAELAARGSLKSLTRYLRKNATNPMRPSNYVVVRLDVPASVAPGDLEVTADGRRLTSKTGLYVVAIDRGRVQISFEVRAPGHEPIATRLYTNDLTGFGTRELRLVPASGAARPACSPPATPLPRTGLLSDPYDLMLPDDCVVGGLRDLPGTWIVRGHEFLYQRFGGDCQHGFTLLNRVFQTPPRDMHQHTWSDGTRFFLRRDYPDIQSVSAYAYCVMPNHSLTGIEARVVAGQRSQTFGHGERLPDLKEPPAHRLTLVGRVDRHSSLHLDVAGILVYLSGANKTDIVDVTDPARPRQLTSPGWSADSLACEDTVAISGGRKPFVYCRGGSQNGLFGFDVSVPTRPRRMGGPLELNGTLLHVQDRGRELLIGRGPRESISVYDVTHPGAEQLVSSTALPKGAWHESLAIADRTLFVITQGQLLAFEVGRGGKKLVQVGQRPVRGGSRVWAGRVHGRRLVLVVEKDAHDVAVLRVLDGTRDPRRFLRELGHYQHPGDIAINAVDSDGKRAYLAYNQAGVRAVDLRNPARPVEVGHYAPDEMKVGWYVQQGPVALRVQRGLVYVADILNGLRILRFDAP